MEHSFYQQFSSPFIHSSAILQSLPSSSTNTNPNQTTSTLHSHNTSTTTQVPHHQPLNKGKQLKTQTYNISQDDTTTKSLTHNTCYHYLNLFLDLDLINWFISECQCSSKDLSVSESEMRCFIATLYLSGYVDVPRRRMLWERSLDTHCPLITRAMQRDRFESIFTALQFWDQIKDDRLQLSKLHPLINLLNDRFLRHCPADTQHCIAECVIREQNKSSQVSKTSFGNGKDLKVWLGCLKSGYCVWFCPSSALTGVDKISIGSSTILSYANKLKKCWPTFNGNLIFENCYAQMPLMYELQRMGIQPSAVDKDKSGCLLSPPLGGVDRLDSNVNLYRTSIRGRKSYTQLMTYLLDVALQNAWQLYRISVKDKKPLDLLSFRRSVVIYYLEHYAKPIMGHKGGKISKQKFRGRLPPPSDARFDGLRHYVVPQSKQTRCAKCKMKTTTRCQKCDVGVHVKCFVDYHTGPSDNVGLDIVRNVE